MELLHKLSVPETPTGCFAAALELARQVGMSQRILNGHGESCAVDGKGYLVDGILVRIALDAVVNLDREGFEEATALLAGFPSMDAVRSDVEGHEGNVLILRVRGTVRQDMKTHGGGFACPETTRSEFERRGFWLDEAESDHDAVGFSRYDQFDGSEKVYWFGASSSSGTHVYASHPRFAAVPEGPYMGCESDGTGYLAIEVSDANDSHTLSAALDTLEVAVTTAFGNGASLRLM